MKKNLLLIICMMLFLSIGIVSASDINQTTVDVVEISHEGDIVNIDNNVNDTVNVYNDDNIDKEVLSSRDIDDTSDDVTVFDEKEVSNDEILRASNDVDVLTDTSTDESTTATLANLRNLIQNNPNNDIILTKNYNNVAYNTGILVKNPSITGNLDNNGGMVILNGNDNLNERLLFISSDANTTISNIKFMNTRSNEGQNRFGGAIRVGAGANVTFINCVFEHDAQCEAGGAIYFESGARGQFYNCTFYDDFLRHETHDDSAIGGTAVAFQYTTLAKFDNCTFRYNHCDSYCNGAVYIGAGSSNIEFDNCTFRDNNAKTGSTSANNRASHNNIKFGKGGAIYLAENITNVTISNSEFVNNTANHYGGAIYVSTGCSVVTIENCTFENNSATFESSSTVYSAAQGGTIHYNVGQGGAIYFDGGCENVSLINSTFKNNVAPNYGGAIYFNGTIDNLLINRSTFENNSAKNYDGGAIYIPDGKTATVDNSTFKYNNAGRNGGSVYWGSESDFATTSSTFEGNSAKDGSTVYFATPVKKITIRDTCYYGNVNTGSGSVGAALKIDLKEGEIETLEIINCTFVGNEVPTDGAAVYVPNTVKNVHVYNCSFSDNLAKSGRGAAIFLDNNNELILLNTTFINNTAKKGATVYFNNTLNSIIIKDTHFINNTVTDDDGAGIKIPDGAAIVEFNNCSFIGNNASGNGGGLYIPNSITSLTISNTVQYRDNVAGGNGGAIYWGIADEIVVENYTFINNTASKGATIYFVHQMNTIIFNNTLFINNTATDDNGAGISLEKISNSIIYNCTFNGNNASGNGGAIYVPSNIVSIMITKTNRFEDNTAGGNGGAIFWASSIDLDISNYTFINNAANSAGAVYYAYALNSKLFDNVTFINNTATNNGGALYILTGSQGITFTGCNFTGNGAAVGYGGAVYFDGASSNILFTNSTFDNNYAKSGGAVQFYANVNYLDSGFENVEITRCNFTNNNATYYDGYGGSAITFNIIKGLNIDECKFDSNVAQANGALMFDYFSNVLIKNTDFTNNRAGSAPAVFLFNAYGDKNATFMKCVFENNTASATGTVTKSGKTLEMGHGGAVYLTGKDHRFIDCNFTNNQVTGDDRDGGAIYSVADNVTVINNRFVNNSANRYAGVLMDVEGTNTLKIIKSTFKENHADSVSVIRADKTQDPYIAECTFEDNYATDGYGCLYLTGFYGLIDNCNFTNNSAKDGSAIAYVPLSTAAAGGSTKANITNCNFAENNATGAGTVYFQSSQGKIENCNFDKNVANYAGGIYVNIGDVLIIKNNFTNNNATEDGGAIYLNSPAAGTNITYCNFNKNNAKNGAAIAIAADNILVTQSNFTNNVATGNGGSIYSLASKSSVVVSNSTFKQNRAANGGAIYYGDATSQSNGLTIYNDTFISNTAIYNGGAIDYLVDASDYWRDYNNFNNESKLLDQTSKRYTWNHNGQEIIFSSYFENNLDYAMNVAVSVQVPTAVITITVPSRFDKATTKINITAVNQTGGRFSEIIDGNNIPSSDWVTVGDSYQITIRLYDQEESKYNTTVGISDKNHNYKEEILYYTVSTITEGRFQALQRMINEAIADPSAGPIPVLELSEDFIYFESMDHGPIHIDAPITIRGTGVTPSRIDALNYCRIFEINSENVTFDNILFANGNASGIHGGSDKSHGGAILWNGENGKITNSVFNTNNAEYGGAVYWNASKGIIENSQFELNDADNGGALMINGVNDVKVLNSTFNQNNHNAIYVLSANGVLINDTQFTSNNDCAVKISGCENLNVTNSIFSSNIGRDVLIDGNDNIMLYNLTVNDSQGDASIYVNGNASMDNIKISSYQSQNAIVFNAGESALNNSEISGNNPIIINNGAIVNLTETKNINNNGAYSVENNGNLFLNKNNFTNVIVNKGLITSKTTTKVMDNATVKINIGQDAVLNVSVVDDNGNVISVPVKFKSNGNVLGDAVYQDKYYYFTYVNPNAGLYAISVNDDQFGLGLNDVENATLKVIDPNTSIQLDVTQQNQGETVIIKATVSPNGASGNVTFIVNDLAYIYELNQTEDLNNEFVATLVLNNLTPNTYSVKATYNGDEDHNKCTSTDKLFIVSKRDVSIIIEVENIAQGDNATAIVTTNANGTVILSLNGRQEVAIENGKAVWNYSDLASGTYTIYVDYAGNTFYNSASNSTTFTVYKFDMNVTVSETQFNQSATITVTLPSDVAVMPEIFLEGKPLTVVNKSNGIFEAVTDNLAVGTYEVNVTFAGDAKYYARDINGTKLVVSKYDSYPFNVTVSPDDIKFGDNVTIEVTGPVGTNVTVTIDDVNYTVFIGDDGKGNLTLNNLTAGNHKIVANITGNENMTSKEIIKEFSIDRAVPDIQVIVPNDIAPGSSANVTVVVGKNATGKAIVTIDGVPQTVNITNGNATVPIPTDKPGVHNITVEYFGDNNYAAPSTVAEANYTVEKYDADIIIKEPVVNDNNSVVVVIEMNPSDATGNVTVSLANGTNITVNLVDGKAEVNVGVLPVNSTMAYNVTYSGDKNYNKTTKVASENLTVGRMNNFDVNVTVDAGKYGENTTVIVSVTPGVGGNVSVVVDKVSYPVTQDNNGNYVAVVPALDLGTHNVTVKFENSSDYADKVINKNYTVVKNDQYDVTVNVTEGKFGENTTIEITAPKDIGKLNVTIDGVNYTVTINETTGKGVFVISNLTAGKHEVTTSFAGDEHYDAISTTNIINIPKAESEMNITVDNNGPGQNVTVTVDVGPNATGIVVVEVNGEKHYVDIDENGTAIYVIENAKPGDYNITTSFNGDDNYAKVNNTCNFTVGKLEADIIIKDPVVKDNNSVVVVIEMNPGDATGNVTVSLANGTNITVELVDGKAEVNVGVLPVNSTMAYNVTYSGDKNYNKTTKVSAENLTVGRLNNFDVNVTVDAGKYGENTTVIVSVTPGVGGNVSVVVDKVSYPVTQDNNGNYVAVVPALDLGTHNVTVKFENSSDYADKVINKNYTVVKNDQYDVTVNVTEGKFGENTTIEITAPKDIGKLNVTIDGVNYTVTINETTGKGVFVISNLTAGKHEVTTSFAGDEHYDAISTTNFINIPKAESEMNITVDNKGPGQNVTVTVDVGPNATGIVVVEVNGEKHYVDIDENGTAIYVIENAKPGDYNITTSFNGDDNYAKVNNTCKFTVGKSDAEINIKTPIVNDNNSVVVVIEMVPGDATGNVTVSLANGTNVTVELVDGKAEVNVGVLPVNSTMAYNVTYSGDKNYNKTTKVATENLTVGRLNNFDVNVTIDEGQYGENTIVTVSVTPGVGGNVSVVVDKVSYPVTQDASGNYVAVVPPSAVGTHNVTVKFENSSNYADREINKTFTVEKNDHYDLNVTIIPTPTVFGNETIVDVSGPAGTNVTVTVDGVNYTVTLNESGKGQLVFDNFTAGSHTVVANFTGNDNYSGKVVEKVFNVDPAVPDIQVIVPENVAPNSDANVTVVVGKNATGKVIVTIDGVPASFNVTNGNVTVPIPTNEPGAHNITVEYFGDGNYAAPSSVTKANYTVDKMDAEINIKDPIVNDDNSVVVVIEMVPGDATGNVTVSLANGTNITVELVDGKAEVNVGVLPVNSTMAYNVTYSGDKNYNKTTKVAAENLTVERLNNFTVNVSVNEGQYGENTTVIVSVTPGVDGDISVVVDNVSYPITQDASGNYVAIVPPLDLGTHNVTVRFENSSNYEDKEINKTYSVVRNDNVDLNVEIIPIPTVFGNETVVAVTGPAGINVTVTVDGVNYTVTLNESGKGQLVFNNFTAGTHTVVANFTGNDKYPAKVVERVFNVNPAVPDIQVIVPENVAPNSDANVTVVVGKNATGKVIVTIDGVPTSFNVTNGNATVPIPTDVPGTHNITVEYFGDGNYAAPSSVTKANYTVDKMDAEINIKDPIVNDDNSVVVVIEMVPGDATGNVTVTLANGTNITVELVDGKAEVNVGVLPVNSTMAYNVTYSGDKNYNKTTKVSADNLTVGRLNNFTVDVTIDEGQYGENTTVIVSVTPGVDGDISIVVDNVSYPVTHDASGNYVAVIPPAAVGTHNVTVRFENSSNYADKVINKNFTVEKNDQYNVNVTITPNPAKFGENTTIEVEIPEGMDNVTVIIDGNEIVVPVNETTGKGKLVIDNLTAGNHTITVVTPGNENFTSTNTTSKVVIEKAVSDLSMNISDIKPGEDVTVSVNVGPNATGFVVVTVNGQEHVVPIDENGTATYVIPDAQPGDLNITAEYYGDNNYEPVKKSENATVPKYPSSMEVLEPVISDNNNVTVVVKVTPANATGTVTVTIDGENYTADVVNGVAEVNIGIVAPNTTPVMNITYSGDKNYNSTELTSVNTVEVGKLNNFTADIEVIPGQFGENTTVKVTVPEDATGNITVTVDGVEYPVVKDENGTYVAEVPSTVGTHTVKVSYTNDPIYNDTEIIKEFDTGLNDKYDIKINVTEGGFGNDTVIEVEIPEGINNVTVSIDGVEYFVPVDNTTGKGKLVIDNLTAGSHNVTVNVPSNGNYSRKSNSTMIDIPKATSDMGIEFIGGEPGENMTVVVNVGPNATGHVVITVNGQEHTVPVDENGTAKYVIPDAQPGDYNITAEFLGDPNYNPVKNNVTKTVPTFPVTMEVLEPVIADNNNVTVVVKVNATDATGTVTVTIDGENYTAEVVNGVAEVNIGIVEPNTTPVMNITYSGDSKYDSANLTAVDTVSVGKLNNFTADIEIIPGQYGENTTVKVTVPEDATGEITVTVDGTEYPVSKDENGTYFAVVEGLSVGNHTVNVTYSGDSRYEGKNSSEEFGVDMNDKYPFDVTITPAPYGEDTVINVTGPAGVNVTVTVDGVNYTVTVGEDGKGNLTLNNLSAGPHDIAVNFTGNDNFTGKSVTEKINVPQQTPDIQVTITPAEPIAPGSDVNVTVSVGKNATGKVIVTVDGVPTTVEVNNGTAVLPISSAQPGNHSVTVEYVGDTNYAAPATVTQANFTVDTYEPTVEVIGVERDENNNVTVSVKVNGTGNVTVKVGDKVYNATVEDGVAKVNIGDVPVGPQDINITYSGDDNFGPVTVSEHIDAPVLESYNLTISAGDIKYGEVAQVNVTLPEGANASHVKFIVDGVENTNVTVLSSGVVQLNVADLGAGNHSIKVVYENDGTYGDGENETVINVAKVEPSTKEINVTNPIEVGQPVNVSVKLPEDANGTITVDVNGAKYVVDVVNGTANVTIPNLGNGTYDLNITYSGDGNYGPITMTQTVVVEKVDPAVTANVSSINLGENLVVNVTVPDDATGTVTVKVGDIEKTLPVAGGLNNLVITDVPVGNHDVEVTYNGDNKYSKNTTMTSVTVNPKPTTADDVKIIDNGDGTITVILPDNATGNVTVKIGDEVLPAEELKDGKATINLTNSSATPGKHNITVAYSGDENHTAVEVNSTGGIPKWESNVNATVSKIREGDDALISVEVSPKGATGKVYAEVNGTTYSADIDENGKAVITVPGLKEGTQNITVRYSGDDNYTDFTTQVQVVVEEPITVIVDGTVEGSQVVINLPNNSTENVTAYIDGEEVPIVFDESGNPTVNLSGVTPGQHNMTIVYVDQNNNTSVVNTQISVPKWPSTVNASAPTIREGDELPITVKVGSADMTGLVLVDINGTGYYANLTNGEAVIYAQGIREGIHNANVTYLGDDKYEVSNNTFRVTVEAPLTISVDGAGNSTKVIVDLPANGTENVTVLVDGNEVPVTVSDGKAVAELNNVTAGDHNVTVIYTDKYGTQSVVNQTIKVYNSIKANNMKRGWNSPYDYEAEFLDKNGHVIANTVMEFMVNGKTYKVKTDSKGIAKLTTSKLAVGKYDVQITNTKTHEVLTKSVTIVKRLIKNKDITMDFADGTYYTVTAIGDDGNPVGKGEVVGITANGRGYVAITNSKGVAKLKINLNPKKYTVVAEYAKYKVSNKLVVKQTLKLVKKTVSVKKSAKKIVLKATLKSSKGKAIKGKQIVFKFYGKTYKAKTNSKGLAKVTVKKNIIKKLKKGKKYVYSAAYKTNVVKGKVKVKK